MKVLFIEAKANNEVTKGLEKNISKIQHKKIGLLATVQFARQLPKIKKLLQTKGFAVFAGKPKGPAVLDGQVLGCDVSAALEIEKKVDCFLYIGTGEFHPLGLAGTNKPIYLFNPFAEQLRELPREEVAKLQKRKALLLEKFKEAKTIGILVSTKPGQFNMAAAEQVKEKLEGQGKKVYLFICDTITNAELQNFPAIDAWVSTACPRLADDFFSKPFVNVADVVGCC